MKHSDFEIKGTALLVGELTDLFTGKPVNAGKLSFESPDTLRGKLIERSLTAQALTCGGWPEGQDCDLWLRKVFRRCARFKGAHAPWDEPKNKTAIRLLMDLDEKAMLDPFSWGMPMLMEMLTCDLAPLWEEVAPYLQQLKAFLDTVPDEVWKGEEWWQAVVGARAQQGPKTDGGTRTKSNSDPIKLHHLEVKTTANGVITTEDGRESISIEEIREVSEEEGHWIILGPEQEAIQQNIMRVLEGWLEEENLKKVLACSPYEQHVRVLIITPGDYLLVEWKACDAESKRAEPEPMRLNGYPGGVWCTNADWESRKNNYLGKDDAPPLVRWDDNSVTLRFKRKLRNEDVARAWSFLASQHFPDREVKIIDNRRVWALGRLDPEELIERVRGHRVVFP